MDPPVDLARAHLRVARPTDDLDAVVRFYRDGLGFDVLSEFRDHAGFDGVMLGHPTAASPCIRHLTILQDHRHPPGPAAIGATRQQFLAAQPMPPAVFA